MPGNLLRSMYPKPWHNHYFGDFLVIFRLSQQDSPYFVSGVMTFQYFPLAAVLLGPFVIFSYWTAFVLYLTVSIAALIGVCWHGLKDLSRSLRIKMIALILISGPMISVIDRGNLSLLLTMFCLWGVLQLHNKKPYRAALLLGLAGAIKGYPALFLLVFLRRREWKQLATGIATFTAATLIPMLFYARGLFSNFREMISQFSGSSSPEHAVNIVGYNSSLFSLFETCRVKIGVPLDQVFLFLENNYTYLGGLILVILCLLSISKYATDLDSLSLITVAICLLPQTVGNYVLLLYFVPLLYLWLNAENFDGYRKIQTIAIAIAMTPKGLPLGLPFDVWSSAAPTYSSLVNPLCGLTIAAMSFRCIQIQRRKQLGQIQQGEFMITNCRLIDLRKISDPRGNLTPIESFVDIPFQIQRVYYLYDVPGGASRGGHAHKQLQQLIVAVSGSFDVTLYDGFEKVTYQLNRSYTGLLVAPMTWREIDNFSSGSVCMVLASENFSEDDYYRDIIEFENHVRD